MMHLRVRPGVIWDEVDGALVVCDLGSGTFFEFNPSGAHVWATGTTGDLEAVLARLTEVFPGVSRQMLEADVAQFTATLEELSLVTSRHVEGDPSSTRTGGLA